MNIQTFQAVLNREMVRLDSWRLSEDGGEAVNTVVPSTPLGFLKPVLLCTESQEPGEAGATIDKLHDRGKLLRLSVLFHPRVLKIATLNSDSC